MDKPNGLFPNIREKTADLKRTGLMPSGLYDPRGKLLYAPLAGLLLPDGTAAAPSLAFASAHDMGLYRVSSTTLGVVAGGVDRFRFSTADYLRHTSSATLFGTHPTYGTNFGAIWHDGLDYALLVSSVGDTFLNCPSGRSGYLRANNADVARWGSVAGGDFEVLTPILADGAITVKGGNTLYVYESTNTNWVRLFRDSANAFLEHSTTGVLFLNWFIGSGGVSVGNGAAGYGTIRAAAFTVSSSSTLKGDVAPLPDDDAPVAALQPKTYTRDGDKSGQTYTGFLAEDVRAVYPDAVVPMTMVDDQGVETQTLGIDLLALHGITVSALRKTMGAVRNLRQQIQQLQTQVQTNTTDIATIKAKLGL